jgi:hypothetical protein
MSDFIPKPGSIKIGGLSRQLSSPPFDPPTRGQCSMLCR